MAHLYHPGGDPSRVYYGTDTRAQAMLLGAVLAVMVVVHGPLRSRLGRALLMVAAPLCLVSTHSIDDLCIRLVISP